MSTILEDSQTAQIRILPIPKYGNGHIISHAGNGRYYWTVDAFYRAIEASVLDEPNRWELLNGEIVDRENMNPPHAFVADELAGQLRDKLGVRFLVREEKPIRIALDSEPTPDITVVAGKRSDFAGRHPIPEDVRLLVEVADTTEEKDTGQKALLYARANISDYWVVLVNRRQVNVYRDPTPDGYPKPQELKAGQTISPLVAPDISISVSDLLPPLKEEADADENAASAAAI